jgi:hypothetical protein
MAIDNRTAAACRRRGPSLALGDRMECRSCPVAESIVVPMLDRRSLAVAAARAARSRSAAGEQATLEGRFPVIIDTVT